MWRKDYSIRDHLGDVRMVLRKNTNDNNYVVSSAFDYKPFGERINVDVSLDNINRTGFIAKEKDNESQLGDFGVRKYEDNFGRFTSIDPLFEKYPGWNPYHYSMNNPVNLFDNNGLLVRDQKGNIVFVPVGNPTSISSAGTGESILAQPGYVITNDGKNGVLVFKNLSDDERFNSNCHGATFGDSKFWINGVQASQILTGDDYNEVTSAKKGDKVLFYSDKGEIEHSMTVSKISKDGQIYVKGEGGLEVGSKEVKLNEAWSDKSNFKFYRKASKDPKIKKDQIKEIKKQITKH